VELRSRVVSFWRVFLGMRRRVILGLRWIHIVILGLRIPVRALRFGLGRVNGVGWDGMVEMGVGVIVL
jgi:hypothetical protein